jgi:hypothetical protein
VRVRADAALALAAATLVASAAFAAEPFGTLFHTPEERARLDRLRRGEASDAAASGTATPAPAARGEVTGFVKRSDGRNTVWIDGMAVPARSPSSAPLLDPRVVRAYADRKQSDLHIQVRPPK